MRATARPRPRRPRASLRGRWAAAVGPPATRPRPTRRSPPRSPGARRTGTRRRRSPGDARTNLCEAAVMASSEDVVAKGIAAGRLLYGLGCMVAPRQMMGPAGQRAEGQLIWLTRAFGVRDFVLGGATLRAL